MGKTITETIESRQLIVGNGVRTENAKPTSGIAYKRGDLVHVDENNMVTHPIFTGDKLGDWDAIVIEDFSQDQSTYHAANNLEMPLYVQGSFDVDVVTVNGVSLTTAQIDSVRAQALKNKIELRKVVGN